MKIINKTSFALNYVVTPSGMTLADAEKQKAIVASGSVNGNSSNTFSAAGWTKPGVYVGRQVATGDSTVSVSIEET